MKVLLAEKVAELRRKQKGRDPRIPI